MIVYMYMYLRKSCMMDVGFYFSVETIIESAWVLLLLANHNPAIDDFGVSNATDEISV